MKTTMPVHSRPRIAYYRARPKHRGWNGILQGGVIFCPDGRSAGLGALSPERTSGDRASRDEVP